MKSKKLKTVNYQNEDMKEIKTLIIITIVVILVAIGLYFLTDRILQNRTRDLPVPPPSPISYTNTIVGRIFDKPYEDYYVFLFSSADDRAPLFNGLLRNFDQEEEAIKIYFVDLSIGFNDHVLSEESNPNPRNAGEVQINEYALMRIRDGRVVAFHDTVEAIENALSIER